MLFLIPKISAYVTPCHYSIYVQNMYRIFDKVIYFSLKVFILLNTYKIVGMCTLSLLGQYSVWGLSVISALYLCTSVSLWTWLVRYSMFHLSWKQRSSQPATKLDTWMGIQRNPRITGGGFGSCHEKKHLCFNILWNNFRWQKMFVKYPLHCSKEPNPSCL